jgi:hypothetical protein
LAGHGALGQTGDFGRLREAPVLGDEVEEVKFVNIERRRRQYSFILSMNQYD